MVISRFEFRLTCRQSWALDRLVTLLPDAAVLAHREDCEVLLQRWDVETGLGTLGRVGLCVQDAPLIFFIERELREA
jgi:hypothetical protein